MSADNWAVCPRCLARAKKAEAEQLAAVMETYGKVPAETFDRNRAAVLTPDPNALMTFREDYEFYGVAQGAVTASYSGGCGTCGLSLQFETTRPIEGVDQ